MTDYPTTPPSDLIQQWLNEPQYITADQAGRRMEMVSMTENRFMELMQKSATYGADQELKACLNWFERYYKDETWIDLDSRTFRLARRPEKRSLKEQALAILDEEPEADDMKELIVFDTAQVDIIRRAGLAEPESEWPTDEEIMKLLPEDLHKEFANWSRIYADGASTKPGIFRVILNTLALDFARAVLNKYGNHPVSPDGSSLRQQAMGALYAIASGADDTREFYQDIETIKLALEQLK